MRLMFVYAMIASFSLATFAGAAQEDERRAAPETSPTDQAAEELPPASARPSPATPGTGRPENRWRYRFAQGRWWFWAPDRQWWYFDGGRWVPYREAGGFGAKKVDPALLRLEAKEGVLGPRKWGPARFPGMPAGDLGWA